MAPVRTALIIALAGILAIYATQIALARTGVPILIASIAGDVVAGAALLWGARHARLDLGLRWPHRRYLLAGLLAGISAWYLALQIVVWVNPPGDEHMLQGVVEHGALAPLLLGLAVLPAFSEELLFRGALARGLAARYPLWIAVGVSGVAFAAYHVMPGQVLGVLPLGLVLGLLAIRSDSVVPGMVAHVVNNAIALVLSRDELPAVTRVLDAWPALTLLGACIVLAASVGLAAKGPA